MALAGVDLAVRPGEVFCLLGPSGSGKTTLLRRVAGFETGPGTVAINGRVVDHLPPERRRVGVVFQDYALFPHRRVSENIAFGLRMQRMPRPARGERVAELLALVRLEGLGDRRPHELSGGQRQRVALARALAPLPDLLLLDEPLANLDRRLRESLRDELRRVQATTGVTTILVTHDQEEALTLSDRIAVLRNGVVDQVGSPVELWQRPHNRFVAEFLGEMNLLAARPVGDGHVEVEALGLRVLAAGGLPPSPKVVACIRPEAVEVVARSDGSGGGGGAGGGGGGAGGGGGGGMACGRVESASYAGGHVTYRVRVGDGTTILARHALAGTSPSFARGDDVAVALSDVPCHLLEG